MGVVCLAIDVRQGGLWPAKHPPGKPSVDVFPLPDEGVSPTLAAAVATSCGLRPEGFLGECSSRPGRRVQGFGAVLRGADEARLDIGPPDPPGALAGVILLAESTLPGSGARRLSIPWLLVRPEARRFGVGRALVAGALDEAHRLGAGRVTIDTLDRWPEAVAFWRRVGFTPRPRTP